MQNVQRWRQRQNKTDGPQILDVVIGIQHEAS